MGTLIQDTAKFVEIVRDYRSEDEIAGDTFRGYRIDTVYAYIDRDKNTVSSVDYRFTTQTRFDKAKLAEIDDKILEGEFMFLESVTRMLSRIGFRLSASLSVYTENSSVLVFQRRIDRK